MSTHHRSQDDIAIDEFILYSRFFAGRYLNSLCKPIRLEEREVVLECICCLVKRRFWGRPKVEGFLRDAKG